mmetsp:Transcript_1658/g.3454  ORF Transcript_1658/g.3454 Transcript_1658/m.3454 type:complete len:276 (-) Transcript_1658:888-1715(-)
MRGRSSTWTTARTWVIRRAKSRWHTSTTQACTGCRATLRLPSTGLAPPPPRATPLPTPISASCGCERSSIQRPSSRSAELRSSTTPLDGLGWVTATSTARGCLSPTHWPHARSGKRQPWAISTRSTISASSRLQAAAPTCSLTRRWPSASGPSRPSSRTRRPSCWLAAWRCAGWAACVKTAAPRRSSSSTRWTTGRRPNRCCAPLCARTRPDGRSERRCTSCSQDTRASRLGCTTPALSCRSTLPDSRGYTASARDRRRCATCRKPRSLAPLTRR